MKKLATFALCALLPASVYAAFTQMSTANNTAPTLTEGGTYGLFLDLLSNARMTLGTLISGEDQTLNRLWGGPKGLCTSLTADGVIKASAGVLMSVNITNASANDDVLIYDNASAASGTVVFDALNVAAGTTIFPNVPAAATNGLYMDLTTAGSMHVLVCYL